jgi:hypothetical protein
MDYREEGLRTRLSVLKAKQPINAADQANIQKNIKMVEDALAHPSAMQTKTEARFDDPQRLRAPRDSFFDMQRPSSEE